MRNILIAAVAGVLLSGCSTEVAVMSLDSAIRQGAKTAKIAAQGAAETVKIEVQATTGLKAGATIPIPVVPISAEANVGTLTKYTIVVNLAEFPVTDAELAGAPALLRDEFDDNIYTLDTSTGLLTR